MLDIGTVSIVRYVVSPAQFNRVTIAAATSISYAFVVNGTCTMTASPYSSANLPRAGINLPTLVTNKIIRISRLLDRQLVKLAHELGISVSDLRIIFLLGERKNCTLKEIIEGTVLDQGNTSRVVAKLVEHGLLHRSEDEDDARKTLLSLTESGLQVLHQASPPRLQLEAMITKEFSDDEHNALSSYLTRIDKLTQREDFELLTNIETD